MEAHLVDLQSQLVNTLSDARRAQVHLELGRHALDAEQPSLARRHLEEALLLDRDLEDARSLLARLATPDAVRPGLLKRIFRR